VPVLEVGQIREFNIGHSIIARALFLGLAAAVREIADLVHGRELNAILGNRRGHRGNLSRGAARATVRSRFLSRVFTETSRDTRWEARTTRNGSPGGSP
jgi:hypothetical protein